MDDFFYVLSNIAEWLLVNELGLIDRCTEVVYDSWFWWISENVVRNVRSDLILKCSLATYCPEVLSANPLCLSIVAALVKSGHLLDRAFILGCNPNTWCFKRVLRHLIKLFVATVGSGNDRSHIDRLLLPGRISEIAANHWEVFVSGVPGRTQVSQHRVDILSWEGHKLLTVVVVFIFPMLRAVNWVDWHFSSVLHFHSVLNYS